MSTVAEIESAIERLAPADYRELMAWIEERRSMEAASESLFALYDEEEGRSDAQRPTR